MRKAKKRKEPATDAPRGEKEQNVKEINGSTKREEAPDVFRKGKFKLLALTETKLKGMRKFHGVG